MSLTQIHGFVAVAEAAHVGRAAEKMRIAQPALSRHIRALEDELGTALFARTPRGMTLLPAGETFLGHAREILARVEAAAVAVKTRAAAGEGGDGKAGGAASGGVGGGVRARGGGLGPGAGGGGAAAARRNVKSGG